MATRVLQLRGASAEELHQGVTAIQQEQHLAPEFPEAVEQAARVAAGSPRLPERDRTDLELVTIDPVGAMDLDQAMHLETEGDGYVVLLEYREVLPVETWNAQISLLTGFAAAAIMVSGKVGILRTLPPAPQYAVSKLRRTARALGIDWPEGQGHADFIRSLDPSHPAEAAMVVACTALLRGAGYAAFDGQLPEQPVHAALASTYAHVTAPLRRLVDRYGLEICAALCAGEQVPQWVVDRLDALPEIMRDSGRRSHAYENAVLNLVEAETLQSRVGEQLEGVITEVEHDDERKGTVMVRRPAVEAAVTSKSPLPVGEDVTVRLTEADPTTRKVRFEL